MSSELSECTEDAFRKCIVFEPDEDKENTTPKIRIWRNKRTNPEQIRTIQTFMKGTNEQLMDQNKWNNLAIKLNSLGPPSRPGAKWKRVWTTHKYNNEKRRLKQSSNCSMDGQPSGSTSQNDRQATSNIAVQGAQNDVVQSFSVCFNPQDQESYSIQSSGNSGVQRIQNMFTESSSFQNVVAQDMVSESSKDSCQSQDRLSFQSEIVLQDVENMVARNMVTESSRDSSPSQDEQSFQDVENVVHPCCILCQDKYDIIINALSDIKSKVDSLCETSKKS